MTASLAVAGLVVATSASAAVAVSRGRRAAVLARLGHRPAPRRSITGRVPAWVWTGVAGAVAGAALAWPLAVPAAAVGAAAPSALRRRAAERRRRRLEAQLPDALAAMARSLRTGASTVQAVAEAAAVTPAPLGAELARTAAAAVAGGLTAALDDLVVRCPLPSMRLAAAALALGDRTGGPIARGVDGVAATLRQHLAVEAEGTALSTQARLSAWLIASAPLVFASLSVATDPAAAQWLLRTPAGLVVLATGVGLDALGAWWMAVLTRRVR